MLKGNRLELFEEALMTSDGCIFLVVARDHDNSLLLLSSTD
jgi:hypothetical protein